MTDHSAEGELFPRLRLLPGWTVVRHVQGECVYYALLDPRGCPKAQGGVRTVRIGIDVQIVKLEGL